MKPTLCLSLKNGVRIVAILDTFISLGMLIVSIGSIIYFEKYEEEVMDLFAKPPPDVSQFLNLTHLSRDTIRIFLGFSTFYWIQKAWLAHLLHRAAVQESTSKCKVWLIYTFLLLILSIAFFLIAIIMQVMMPYAIPGYIVIFIVREYSIWVVLRFKFQIDEKAYPPLIDIHSEFTNL